ncbi:MAG: hemolysin III family protein [Candidatus Binatia bacterium]
MKDPFSCYSHLLGVALAIPGLVWLMLRADGEPWRTVGCAIYGATLIVLYTASTLYHWSPVPPHREALLQRFDHTAIYLLIAGTYTPVCLVTLRGAFGWSLFGVMWGCAVIGSLLKLFFRELPRWLSTASYLGMSWVGVVAVVPLLRALPLSAVSWLLLGGLCYTAGAVIYGLRRPDPYPERLGFHEIFHVFVLAGSALHFVFIARYIAPDV